MGLSSVRQGVINTAANTQVDIPATYTSNNRMPVFQAPGNTSNHDQSNTNPVTGFSFTRHRYVPTRVISHLFW